MARAPRLRCHHDSGNNKAVNLQGDALCLHPVTSHTSATILLLIVPLYYLPLLPWLPSTFSHGRPSPPRKGPESFPPQVCSWYILPKKYRWNPAVHEKYENVWFVIAIIHSYLSTRWRSCVVAGPCCNKCLGCTTGKKAFLPSCTCSGVYIVASQYYYSV